MHLYLRRNQVEYAYNIYIMYKYIFIFKNKLTVTTNYGIS